jgi:hypothetical protein
MNLLTNLVLVSDEGAAIEWWTSCDSYNRNRHDNEQEANGTPEERSVHLCLFVFLPN